MVLESILPNMEWKRKTFSEWTARAYMKSWGFMFKAHGKNVYMDGHERADVVMFRSEWVKRMLSYENLMVKYSGAEMEIADTLTLKDGEREIVQIAHDECAFHANDAKKSLWMTEDERICRKKGEGKAFMVSGFICQCHGLLDAEYITPGKNSEGYWTSAHMTRQLAKVITIFESQHPNKTGLFCFDQSSNHSAFAEDALLATNMNLNPGGKQHKLKDGWFMKDGQKIEQKMVNSEGEAKGIKLVLIERGLWNDSLRLDCAQCPEGVLDCCARTLMSNQADFQAQQSVLAEMVVKAGHLVEFFPKFHCECNPIERVWSIAKREARGRCDFSFPNLKIRVPAILKEVSVASIRAFYRRTWRYIHAYSMGWMGWWPSGQ